MERTIGVTTHVTPHVFRHALASNAIDRGMNIVDVSKLLGHNRVETTMEYITTNSNSIKTVSKIVLYKRVISFEKIKNLITKKQ